MKIQVSKRVNIKPYDMSFNVPGNTLGYVSRGIPTSSDITADITNPIHHAPTH